MLLIFGLVHRNRSLLFIMIPMKIFTVSYVGENISLSIHPQISIGSIKNSIKNHIMNVMIPHSRPLMKMVFL